MRIKIVVEGKKPFVITGRADKLFRWIEHPSNKVKDYEILPELYQAERVE